MAASGLCEENVPLLSQSEDGANDGDTVAIDMTRLTSNATIQSPDNRCSERQPCVPLNAGKKFHVFLAHSSEEEDYVRKLLERLEDEPFNLKCCYSHRDFIPGQPVTNLMENYILQSQNVLLVMSPSFLESNFCQEEKRMAEYYQVVGENRIIPIRIKNCHLPLHMKLNNYIDAHGESDEEVIRKIVEAIKHGTSVIPSPDLGQVLTQMVPPDRNGRAVHFLATPGLKVGKSRFRSLFVKLSEEEKTSCESIGLKMRKLTREWTDLMSQCLYLKYNLLICLTDVRSYILLFLCKYDTKLCQNYTKDYLLKDANDVDGRDHEELEKIAEKVIEIAIPGYLKCLFDNPLKATSVRHATVTNCTCICQYVQLKNLHIQTQGDMQENAVTKQSKLIKQILNSESTTCLKRKCFPH